MLSTSSLVATSALYVKNNDSLNLWAPGAFALVAPVALSSSVASAISETTLSLTSYPILAVVVLSYLLRGIDCWSIVTKKPFV